MKKNLTEKAKEFYDEFKKRVKQLRKTDTVRLGVTQINRIAKYPLQGMLYSSIMPGKSEPSIALVRGTLAHSTFDVHYDCAPDTPSEQVLDLARENMTRGYYHTSARFKFYRENQDRIDAEVLGFYCTFRRWAPAVL